jgi:hypothetical protein
MATAWFFRHCFLQLSKMPFGMIRKGVAAQACFGRLLTTILLVRITYGVILLTGEVSHNTAVFRPAGLGLVAGDRLGLAVPFGGYTAGVNPEGIAFP